MAKAKYILAGSPNILYIPGRKLMIHFRCPGCDAGHYIRTVEANDYLPDEQGAKPIWGFNGDLDRPTFTPSILTWWPIYENGIEIGREKVCHSFVTDGRIQFLSDCWHSLKNQTIELPEI